MWQAWMSRKFSVVIHLMFYLDKMLLNSSQFLLFFCFSLSLSSSSSFILSWEKCLCSRKDTTTLISHRWVFRLGNLIVTFQFSWYCYYYFVCIWYHFSISRFHSLWDSHLIHQLVKLKWAFLLGDRNTHLKQSIEKFCSFSLYWQLLLWHTHTQINFIVHSLLTMVHDSWNFFVIFIPP